MYLKVVCVWFWLHTVVSGADYYSINADWILKESYPKIQMKKRAKEVCEEICMRYDCLKSNTDVATYCKRLKCPTKESCNCDFDKITDFNTLTPKFMDCIKLTSWWKKLRLKKIAYATKCGVSIDSFSMMFKGSQNKRFKISWGNEAEQLRFPWSFRINAPTMKKDKSGKLGRWVTVDELVGSAVLIGPKTLLTAKHNLVNTVQRMTYTYHGGDVAWKNGGKAKATRIVEHPTLDLAIIELDRQINNTAPICLPSKSDVFPPPDIPGSDLQGYPYRTAGWGRTFEGPEPDRLTWFDLKWDAGPITTENGPTCGAGLDYICSRNGYFGTYNVCYGDSGTGWIYRKLDSEVPIIRWYLMGILRSAQTYKIGDVKCEKTKVAEWAMWVNIKKQIDWICDNSRAEC